MVSYLTNAGMLRDMITLNSDSGTIFMLVMAFVLGTLAVTPNKRVHTAIVALMPVVGILMILLN